MYSVSVAAAVAALALTFTPVSLLAQESRQTKPATAATASQAASRSAQSDCNREAANRGWPVVEARNYRQGRDGWTLDLVVRNRRGETVQGSCFVDGRTGEATLYGIGWAEKPSGESIEFKCVSPESNYRECQLPIDGRVELVKKISDAPCREGQDWGRRGDRIWVKHGCRAKFRVYRGSGGGTSGAGGASPAVAERTCQREAEKRGYRVVSQAAAQPVAGGYRSRMSVIQPNTGAKLEVKCILNASSMQVRFEL